MRYWDLGIRADRRYAYGYLLRRGLPLWIHCWVDGPLLVDLWDELDLPIPYAAPGTPSSTPPRRALENSHADCLLSQSWILLT